MNKIKRLEIILKTVERCNINCTYCYFFHGGDESYKFHPPFIAHETIVEIAKFLKQGCKELSIESLQIDFHGGEPLMQKKQAFDKMCEYFKSELENVVNLEFALQTNAMLVNEDWIKLFEKYNVKIGISLDGPKKYNDVARVDFKNKSTYDKVVQGLNLLNKAADEGRIVKPGLLCVINPKFSGKEIYRHFVDNLNVTAMDFLLPDFTHDSFIEHTDLTGLTAIDYGNYLCNIFDEWAKDDNPNISIRLLDSTMLLLLGKRPTLLNFGYTESLVTAFTISSNGDLGPDDTLRPTKLMNSGKNVNNASLKEFLAAPIYNMIEKSIKTMPKNCTECCWEKICKGHMLVNRYSNDNGFNNPSIMCEGLKKLYSHVSSYLITKGLPYNKIEQVLGM
ncbi:MAG: radical SAM protein [Sphingobacteriia bacterium]|nr:radical SAM protein [Sphingobacteriia bacterium]